MTSIKNNCRSKLETEASARLVSLNTDVLKTQLSTLYAFHKTIKKPVLKRSDFYGSNTTEECLFDHLWDLKEMALLQGKSKIDVPEEWLNELESSLLACNLVNK